jgi:hypothetical protein
LTRAEAVNGVAIPAVCLARVKIHPIGTKNLRLRLSTNESALVATGSDGIAEVVRSIQITVAEPTEPRARIIPRPPTTAMNEAICVEGSLYDNRTWNPLKSAATTIPVLGELTKP